MPQGFALQSRSDVDVHYCYYFAGCGDYTGMGDSEMRDRIRIVGLALAQISPYTWRIILVSQGFAVAYWLLALALRSMDIIPIWYDQSLTFTQSYPLLSPYGFETSRFIYPPWAAVVFTIFSHMPFIVATLVQICLFFAILTAVILKFKGGMGAAIITFTSFIMFDAVLELNIEWLIYLGLLVPPQWSGPFLIIKPQSAFGYWLGLRKYELVWLLIVLLLTILVSLVIWGAWPLPMLEEIRTHTLASAYYSINIAPLSFLPVPIALAIGVITAVLSVRRHDPAMGILAGLFFVPYITLYSLPLPFAIVAIRWPRWALLISVVMWVVYGGVIARYYLLA